jgi:hypothetical protein
MEIHKFAAVFRILLCAFAGNLLAGIAATVQAALEYKMTTPIAPGVATPDTLETSIGTLYLSDGVPKSDTTEMIYDNLDRFRALQAYLLAIPIVNQASMRETLRKFGPDNETDVIWETRVDSKTAVRTRVSWSTRMARLTSGSGPRRRQARKTTGCRRSPERAGS